jgi:hypothetical protein
VIDQGYYVAGFISVMSIPMIAKSPDSSSKMSGQLLSAIVCAPLACGSGPIRRLNMANYYYSNVHCQGRFLVAVKSCRETAIVNRFVLTSPASCEGLVSNAVFQ